MKSWGNTSVMEGGHMWHHSAGRRGTRGTFKSPWYRKPCGDAPTILSKTSTLSPPGWKSHVRRRRTNVSAPEINPKNRHAFTKRQGGSRSKCSPHRFTPFPREAPGPKQKAKYETNEQIRQFESTSLQTRCRLFKLRPLPGRHLPGAKRVKRTKRTKRVQRMPPAHRRSP